MGIKIGVNGFGRIGRLVVRAGMAEKDLEFVAVNDLTDPKTLAHLFKYDSTFGTWPGKVQAKEGSIVIDGREIKVIAEKEPANLPWKSLGVDIVVESTGKFTDATKAKAHLDAGAKRVIITAPAKNEDVTICMGVNENAFDPAKHKIISNASCTTNCLAPMAKVIMENFGIKRGLMTTIHSITNDQKILDFPHKDLRRSRAASVSMIPTTTGAAKAIALVIPALKGKLNGIAMRVPTPDVSVVDLVVETEKPTTKEAVNEALKKAAAGPLSKYLEFCSEPLVSIDFKGNSRSCIVDGLCTDVMEGTLVKVLGWYDNEWGYSCRVLDIIRLIAGK